MGWARFDQIQISNVPIVAKFGAYNLLFWRVTEPKTDVVIGARPVLYVYAEGGTSDGDTAGPLDQNGAVRCAPDEPMLFEMATMPSEDAREWHHYAGTYDVETRMMYLYVDGVLRATEDASVAMLDGTIAQSDHDLQIGRWQTTGPTLLGAIDDVRVYDVALAPDEIALIASGPR
jgi:hypothetical protein